VYLVSRQEVSSSFSLHQKRNNSWSERKGKDRNTLHSECTWVIETNAVDTIRGVLVLVLLNIQNEWLFPLLFSLLLVFLRRPCSLHRGNRPKCNWCLEERIRGLKETANTKKKVKWRTRDVQRCKS
jgi:hypothetical protein